MHLWKYKEIERRRFFSNTKIIFCVQNAKELQFQLIRIQSLLLTAVKDQCQVTMSLNSWGLSVSPKACHTLWNLVTIQQTLVSHMTTKGLKLFSSGISVKSKLGSMKNDHLNQR